MNILIISQYFWPENFKINDIAKHLKAKKFEITVLTTYPSYPHKDHFVSFNEKSRIPKDLKNIDIIRVPTVARTKGYINLLLNYISFTIVSIFHIFAQLRKKKFDLIFVFQTSPATVLIPALLMSRITKAPIIVWILDLWPETLAAMGIIKKNSFLYHLSNKFFTFLYQKCDVVLCQSKSIRNIINKKTHSRKALFFPSWAEDIFNKKKYKKFKLNLDKDNFKIIYSGNIGKAQDFNTIIQAAKILKKNNNLNIKWCFFGSGSYHGELKKLVLKEKLSKEIIFKGTQDIKYMPSVYQQADALIVSLNSNEISSITIPGKIQTYMTASKPIIGVLDGEAKNIIKQAKCGIVVKPGNSKYLAREIEKLYFTNKIKRIQLGSNAKKFSTKYFLKSEIMRLLIKLIAKYAKK